MIRVERLSVRFGDFQLHEVSLTVGNGECFCLLGPSGAGKTLLLETLLGIKRPDAGSIRLDGREILDLPPERREIGYVPQDLALFPHLSVRENVLFGPRVRGLSLAQAHADLAQLVELLDLQTILDRRDPTHLSGGEKQRVALARALIVRPSILFLDEPFASLDEAIRRELQLQFRSLQRTLGVTFFQVTHDHEEAFLMADRMGILMEGRLIQVGTPEEVYRRPASRQVARFLMMQNLFLTEVVQAQPGAADCLLGGLPVRIDSPLPLRAGQQVHLGIWPEEIWMARPDRPPVDGRRENRFPGVVEDILNLGTRQWLRVRLQGGAQPVLHVALSHLALRAIQPQPGEAVQIQLPAARFCVFLGEEADDQGAA